MSNKCISLRNYTVSCVYGSMKPNLSDVKEPFDAYVTTVKLRSIELFNLYISNC